MLERRSPTSSGRERWKPSASPSCSAPAPPCSAVSPSARRSAPEPRRERPPVSPSEAPSSSPTPSSSCVPPSTRSVERAVDAVGDPAQPPDFVAGRGDHPGQGPRAPCLRQERRVLARGFGELGRQFAGAAQGVVLELRLQGAEAELEGETADRGLPLAVGELLRPFAEPCDRAARLLAARRGLFEAAGEQPGPLARPFGSEGQQGAARGALGEAAAQFGDGVGRARAARARVGRGRRSRPGPCW